MKDEYYQLTLGMNKKKRRHPFTDAQHYSHAPVEPQIGSRPPVDCRVLAGVIMTGICRFLYREAQSHCSLAFWKRKKKVVYFYLELESSKISSKYLTLFSPEGGVNDYLT
ncbi:hypothetical protein NPIL_107341 [Nephila pilipes]|uniref:Uncharacterized protein n=1 Tax=Nephila pilipes TaxID=299642 RepID=A0A8X6NY21_NEPPI|nr:hypothetical protein NPIL_107341 [Nephila pilipes]